MNNVSCNPDESFAQTKELVTWTRVSRSANERIHVGESQPRFAQQLAKPLSGWNSNGETYGVARVYSCTGLATLLFFAAGKEIGKKKRGEKRVESRFEWEAPPGSTSPDFSMSRDDFSSTKRERERDGGCRYHGGGREHAEVENRFCLLTLRSTAEKIEPCPGVYSIGEGDLGSFALQRMEQDLIMVDRYFKCLRGRSVNGCLIVFGTKGWRLGETRYVLTLPFLYRVR